MTVRHRLVIVGNGMAGVRLAENVVSRDANRSLRVEIFGDESGGSYNRVLLPDVLAGAYAPGDVVTHDPAWYAAHGIVLREGTRIERIDLATRHVVDAAGSCAPFDTVVLATGSTPIVPPIAGLHDDDGTLKAGAFVFRTCDDCARLASSASRAARAVIIGGGLLGLEAARALLGHGIDVTVVHLADRVMDAQLDAMGGRVLVRQLRDLGIEVRTGMTAVGVRGLEHVEAVQFADGSELACEVLVIAAGVRPNVELARRAGLTVGRGIVVGDDLACPGAAGVYAIGDCAEHRGRVYGLVAPAWEQADVLADRLTGRRADATYAGSRLATKLKVAGVDVAVMGARDPQEDDEVVSYVEPGRGIYGTLIVRNDRLNGAILIGAATAVPGIMQHYLDGRPLPYQRSELLFPASGESPVPPVDEMADTTRICDCNAVPKARIVEAVLSGARSLRAVCEQTRAATGCGSCRSEVQRIVDHVCDAIASDRAAAAPAGIEDGVAGAAHATV